MTFDPITQAFESLGALPSLEGGFLRHLLLQAIDDPELATDRALSKHLQLVPQVLRALPLEAQLVRQMHSRPDVQEWARSALSSIAVDVAAGSEDASSDVLTKLSQISLRDSRFLANFLENRPVSQFIDENFLAALKPHGLPVKIEGTAVQSMPSLTLVRNLEMGRDGFRLSEFSASEASGVYVGWRCGEYDGWFHALFVRSEQRSIAQFLARRLTTRELLGVLREDVGFLVSIHSSEPRRIRVVVVSGLPPTFLPLATELHNPDLRPESDEVPQSFLVEETWSAELFYRLEKDYRTAFALTYFLDSKLPEAMHEWLLRGYNYGNLYEHLRNALPDNANAKATALSAASPGVLTITASKQTAEKLAFVLHALASPETAKAYHALHAWSTLKEETEEHLVPIHARDDLYRLADMLSVDVARLVRGGVFGQNAVLRGGKILASYYRCLRRIAAPGAGIEFLPPQVRQPESEVRLAEQRSPTEDEEDARFDEVSFDDKDPDE